MLKILRLLFVARIELFNNNGTPRSRENQNNNKGTQSIMANTGPLMESVDAPTVPQVGRMSAPTKVEIVEYIHMSEKQIVLQTLRKGPMNKPFEMHHWQGNKRLLAKKIMQ